jgi:hypothetical protein
MKLILAEHYQQLLANGRATSAAYAEGTEPPEHRPVVKLFTPDAQCTWLLSELDPDEPDIAFGLCDLGFGTPELGSVRISELEAIRGQLGLPVERDRFFKPAYTLTVYARAAQRMQGITEYPEYLDDAQADLQAEWAENGIEV